MSKRRAVVLGRLGTLTIFAAGQISQNVTGPYPTGGVLLSLAIMTVIAFLVP